MSMNDKRLRELLKQWKDTEPCANFEANVWRRIRLAQAEHPKRVSLPQLVQRCWLWRPAMAVAVAVVASVVIGSSAGVLSKRGRTSVAPSELQFLGTGTLAGSYVKASAGGGR